MYYERVQTYIRSLEKQNSTILETIERQAHIDGVPIIRKEIESFLRTILTLRKPQKILELGTAVGYSALFMNECTNAHIITIENYEKRIDIAKKNIHWAGKDDYITILSGDALEVMKELEAERFDFIFMDAAKAQYIYFLPEVFRLMKSGAVLITDNVLQDRDTLESKFVVPRRDRTIHKRMRQYLEVVKNHPGLITSIIPLGDGITMSVKK